MDDAISVEAQWREDGARYKALTASLANAYFQAMGERGGKEESLLPREKMTRWSTAGHVGHDGRAAAEEA